MPPSNVDQALRTNILRRAQAVRDHAGDKQPIHEAAADLHDDVSIVLLDVMRRVLARSDVVLEPSRVPPSRAAYTAGFALFLATTLTGPLRLDRSSAAHEVGVRVASGLFNAFDPAQREKLFTRGLGAMQQMLGILERAGQLDRWIDDLLAALGRYIADADEDDLAQLTEKFSTLPLKVRDLQSGRPNA